MVKWRINARLTHVTKPRSRWS